MNIRQASNHLDWISAAALLSRVAKHLENIGRPLWNEVQVSVEGLQSSYQLDELYFMQAASEVVGVVFLQESDPYFWPDVVDQESLYVHKLAIEPSLSGEGYGSRAVSAVVKHAENEGFRWVRLDCDDRPKLHEFYQSCGFELIDIRQIESFQVARYRLTINLCGAGSAALHPPA